MGIYTLPEYSASITPMFPRKITGPNNCYFQVFTFGIVYILLCHLSIISLNIGNETPKIL